MTDVDPGLDVGVPPSPAGIVLPPNEADVLSELGKSRRSFDPTSGVLDPGVGPKDRLLTGAAIYSNSPGAARGDYAQWRLDRVSDPKTPTPRRPGISEKQARILVAPDDKANAAKLIAGRDHLPLAGFLNLYETGAGPGAPVDIARFDRAFDEGKLRGRAADLYRKAIDSRLDDNTANELGTQIDKVTRLLDGFDDDLTIGGGKGKLLTVDTNGVEPRLRVAYDRAPPAAAGGAPLAAPGAVTALPAESMPPTALTGDVGPDITLDIGEADATFIAPLDDDTDAINRRGFPAAVGTDGTPRWLKVAPAHLYDVNDVEAAAQRVPTAQVETHQRYAGTFPYDSIVFDYDGGKLNPLITDFGAISLGRGFVNEPVVAAKLIAPDELVDGETVRQHLAENQWAIFTGPVKLHPKYTPIPVRSAGREGTLVFGISPNEAVDASAGLVYVNDGVAIRKGNLDDLDVPDDEWLIPARDGSTTEFVPETDDSLRIIERRQRQMERYHIPITEQMRARINDVVADVELRGGTNPVVYASDVAVDGFERARDHVYTDGTGAYKVARTGDRVLGDANAVPVWVRRADGLPGQWVPVPPTAHDTSMEELLAERVGNKFRFDARDSPDLAAPIRAAHAVAQRRGYNAVEVIGPKGRVTLAEPPR